jgi:predicted nucleic acid-binding protein
VKPIYLFDTGPLSVSCGFPAKGTPYIYTLLDYAAIMLSEDVVNEIQGAGKMARVISPLLKTGQVSGMTTPLAPAILDIAYSRGLGVGERSVIKCGLATNLPIVMDDQEAFVVACRFGLHPIGFQDFIVRLVTECAMPKITALEIVRASARQFPAMYLTHMLDMLS